MALLVYHKSPIAKVGGVPRHVILQGHTKLQADRYDDDFSLILVYSSKSVEANVKMKANEMDQSYPYW